MTQTLAQAQAENARLAAGLRLNRIEKEAAEQRARLAELEKKGAPLKVSEPMTYGPGSQHSFFLDAARARTNRGDGAAARGRLDRHHREMETVLERRRQVAERRARDAYEDAFASDRAGYEALARMTAAGITPFEKRAISRTDSEGGYFTLPAFLLDAYVPYAREASPFATTWTSMDLPDATAVINVPRIKLGTVTGPQADTGAAPTQDIQDSLVSAPVKTVAGVADAAQQWLEQGQGSGGFGVDQMIYQDLVADLALNVDGQLLVGSGTGSQLLGVWPAGSIAAANGIVVADTTAIAWTAAAGTASIHVYLKQTASLLRRIRARSDGLAWFWHPFAWETYLAQVDTQARPLYMGPSAGLPDGAAGDYQGVPVYADTNIPTTFGATPPPSIGPSSGQYSPIPGGGTYTPLLLARPADLHLFQGSIRFRVLPEVLSGAGLVRFQLHQYLAAMPNRYVAAAAVGSSVSAGGDAAHATLTSQHSGSLLILSGSGY